MRPGGSVLLAVVLIGISGCGSFQSTVGSWNIFGWRTCHEYKQSSQNYEFAISAAKGLVAQGKMNEGEFIKVDQEAGLYSSQIKQACDAFINDKISWDQYQRAVDKAYAKYIQLRKLILDRQ